MMIFLGDVLLLLGVTALFFLIYTLLNLDKLGIKVTHPRVLVEFTLFIALTVLGFYLRIRNALLKGSAVNFHMRALW